MTAPTWTPMPPLAEPPKYDRAEQEARALRARLDRMAEEEIANNPRLADAIRRRKAQEQGADDAAK